jgi:hypothetical protein
MEEDFEEDAEELDSYLEEGGQGTPWVCDLLRVVQGQASKRSAVCGAVRC